MGILNKVSSAASSIADNTESKISKGLVRTDYRTGVLNDFSIATKAVFYVLEYVYKSNVPTFKLSEALPVQINPDHLYHAAAKKVTRQDTISGSGKSMESTDGSNFNTSVEIQVIYDIYDDYISSGEGIINGGRGSNISLLDKNYTSLPKLLEFGINPNFRKKNQFGRELKILFKWGEIEHFGIISGVNAEYTAFSRWGSPLKCNASVTMELESMPENMSMSSVMSEVTAYTKKSDVLNYATLTGMKIEEEYAGIALGAVQSLRSLI